MVQDNLTDTELLKLFVYHNHNEYLKKPLKIGFTSFSEVYGVAKDSLIFEDENMPIEARFTKLSFGAGMEFQVDGIVTDRYESKIHNRCGSHAFVSEAKLMRLVALKLAAKHDLMICDYACCWPNVRLIVQKPTEAHLKCFAEEQKKLLA